jgi:alpha 1,6-mannosyltransferase
MKSTHHAARLRSLLPLSFIILCFFFLRSAAQDIASSDSDSDYDHDSISTSTSTPNSNTNSQSYPESEYESKMEDYYQDTAPEQSNYLEDDLLPVYSTSVLPNIPPRIWQTWPFHPFKPDMIPTEFTTSWVLNSPSYRYSLLDDEGNRALVEQLSMLDMPQLSDALEVFDRTEHRIVKGDLVRYALLAVEGGIYSDLDVEMIKPLASWVPDNDKWKDDVKLIVGVEADDDPPVYGMVYPVQFATWTIAGQPGHPVFWTMIERLLLKLRTWPENKRMTNKDVLSLIDPAVWTAVVYAHLSEVTGETITSQNVTGLREPKLFGDVLVLPIDGFATGMGHSGASDDNTDSTMVRRHFSAAWRNGGDLRALYSLEENAARAGYGWGRSGWLTA